MLLDNPDVIYGFDDNNIWITGTTLQELDAHKKDRGERGYNARKTGRILNEYHSKYGDLNNMLIDFKKRVQKYYNDYLIFDLFKYELLK